MTDKTPADALDTVEHLSEIVAEHGCADCDALVVELEAAIREQQEKLYQLFEQFYCLSHSHPSRIAEAICSIDFQLGRAQEREAELVAALKWHGAEAEAIGRHLEDIATMQPEAVMASLRVLGLDGGRRARERLARIKQERAE